MLRMLDVLRQQVRQAVGRGAESSVGIIDSQSVNAADNVGRDTRGYDVGERWPDARRFIITDPFGPLITVSV